jgi:chromosomal replication initiation ATPase DnaA
MTAVSARRELGSRLVAFAERWFDVPQGSIQNPKKRNGNVTKARWAIACALTEIAGWSQPAVAKLFGQADHTSVNNGLKRCQVLLKTDQVFFDGVQLLKREIAPE